MSYSTLTADEYAKMTPYQKAQVPMDRKMELLQEGAPDPAEDTREKVGDISDEDFELKMNGYDPSVPGSKEITLARIKANKQAKKDAKSRHVPRKEY